MAERSGVGEGARNFFLLLVTPVDMARLFLIGLPWSVGEGFFGRRASPGVALVAAVVASKSSFPFAAVFSRFASDEESVTIFEELASTAERGEKDAAELLALSIGVSMLKVPAKLLLLVLPMETLPEVVSVVGDLEAMDLKRDLVMV